MRIRGGTMKRPTFQRASVPWELLGKPLALDNRVPKKTVETCKQRKKGSIQTK